MPIPDLADRTLFPPFLALPEAGAAAPDDGSAPVLLAQVENNMTITKPTLVLRDRDGHAFALLFEGFGHSGLDLGALGCKKGATVVVSGARRTVPAAAPAPDPSVQSAAARRPFVRIDAGQAHTVRAVPATLDVVVAAAARLRRAQAQAGEGRRCDACAAQAGKLLRCTACGEAWYCNRTCQTAGWAGGHKLECKAIRGMSAIWGST